MNGSTATKITWFMPVTITFAPDEVVFTRTKIVFPHEIAAKFPDNRVAVGISESRHAIFFKPDKSGYKLRIQKNSRPSLPLKSTRYGAAVLAFTKSERRVVQASTMSDGAFGCFL